MQYNIFEYNYIVLICNNNVYKYILKNFKFKFIIVFNTIY